MKIRIWLVLLVLCCKIAFPIGKNYVSEPRPDYKAINGLLLQSRHLVLKNPDSARKIAKWALVLSKKINYQLGVGKSFDIIGSTYWAQSFLSISQFYLLQSVPYLKGDNDALLSCYTSIARNYIDLNDYNRAQNYLNLCLKLVNSNTARKAEIYTEFTLLYELTGNYNAGLRYIDTALKYCRITHNYTVIGILYGRRGQIFIRKKQLDKALLALDTCYRFGLQTHNKRLQSIVFNDRARIAVLKKNLPQAIGYAKKACLMADTLKTAQIKIRSLNILADIYNQQHHAQQAYLMQSEISKLYKQIDKVKTSSFLEVIQDYLVLNDKLNHIEQVNRTNSANETLIKTQHRTIALLIILLVTAVTFLGIIFFYYKQKNLMNSKLQTQHQILLDQKKLIEIQRTDLEEVNKLKDKLLAIIGHDLRTPIASISNIADLFSAGYITADEVKNLMLELTPIIKGADLTLLNLLEFAGSQIKGTNMVTARLDMFLIANEMEQIFKHQLQQKNISFHNQLPSEPNAWAGESYVKIILRNLISNAIKFTNDGGSITVSASVKDNQMQVCVGDTGVGMSPDEAAKLFNANLHFSQTGTSGEKGTGLGLLLCKELIGLNKGQLWVDTVAGEGCKFNFTIPLFIPSA